VPIRSGIVLLIENEAEIRCGAGSLKALAVSGERFVFRI
jgi:hypothetical protein